LFSRTRPANFLFVAAMIRASTLTGSVAPGGSKHLPWSTGVTHTCHASLARIVLLE